MTAEPTDEPTGDVVTRTPTEGGYGYVVRKGDRVVGLLKPASFTVLGLTPEQIEAGLAAAWWDWHLAAPGGIGYGGFSQPTVDQAQDELLKEDARYHRT
jgi:hypothetical protein